LINPLLKKLITRQKKGRKQKTTDKQKQLDVIAKITDSSYQRAELARKNEFKK
jgi:hypothetical protein